MWWGSSADYAGATIKISAAGQANFTGAKITGGINATHINTTSGSIANFTIAPTGLTSTGVGMFPAGQTYAFTAGTGNEPSFSVDHSGALTASSARLGPWNVTADAIGKNSYANFSPYSNWALVNGRRIDLALSASFTSHQPSAFAGLRVRTQGNLSSQNQDWIEQVKVGAFQLSTVPSFVSPVTNSFFENALVGYDFNFKNKVEGLGNQNFSGDMMRYDPDERNTYWTGSAGSWNATSQMGIASGAVDKLGIIKAGTGGGLQSPGWDRFITYFTNTATHLPAPHWQSGLTASVYGEGDIIHQQQQVIPQKGKSLLFEPHVVVFSIDSSFTDQTWGQATGGTQGSAKIVLEQDITGVYADSGDLIDFNVELLFPQTQINFNRMKAANNAITDPSVTDYLWDITTHFEVLVDRNGGTNYSETLISANGITLGKNTPNPDAPSFPIPWGDTWRKGTRQNLLSGSLSDASIRIQAGYKVIFNSHIKSQDYYDLIDGSSAYDDALFKVHHPQNSPGSGDPHRYGFGIKFPAMLLDSVVLDIGGRRFFEASDDGFISATKGSEVLQFKDDGLKLRSRNSIVADTFEPKSILFDVSSSLEGSDGSPENFSSINPTIGFNSPAKNTSTGSLEELIITGMLPYASTSLYPYTSTRHGYSAGAWTKVGSAGDLRLKAKDGGGADAFGNTLVHGGDGGNIYLQPGVGGQKSSHASSNPGYSGSIVAQGHIDATGHAITASYFKGDGSQLTNVAGGGGGTITGVTAGNGLTGGGTTGTVTLNVGAGTGIDVAADTISVDVSDFMANGTNNYVLTATGADAMNAEANLTFNGSTLAVTGAQTVSGDFTVDTDLLFADVSADKVSITGTGSNKVTNKTLQINYNNTNTALTSGNGIDGGSVGDGILIENHSTTTNSYANLDFRADTADGRIALQKKGVNTGDFVFIQDNSGIHETLRIDSDSTISQNEVEIISSAQEATGLITRQYLAFGSNSGASTTGTTTVECTTLNGATNGRGYRMMRAGSITGVSIQCDVITAGAASTVTVQVFKNGSNVFSDVLSGISATGDFGTAATQNIGVDTFSAGDQIMAKIVCAANSSYLSVDDVAVLVEISTSK